MTNTITTMAHTGPRAARTDAAITGEDVLDKLDQVESPVLHVPGFLDRFLTILGNPSSDLAGDPS